MTFLCYIIIKETWWYMSLRVTWVHVPRHAHTYLAQNKLPSYFCKSELLFYVSNIDFNRKKRGVPESEPLKSLIFKQDLGQKPGEV